MVDIVKVRSMILSNRQQLDQDHTTNNTIAVLAFIHY